MGLEKPKNFDEVNVRKRNDPDPGTFEFGLVLGGTVSAGAYTAGFIDFLIQALDEYSARGGALTVEGTLPFKVKLKVMSGTSGGGMVAAQAGRALFRDFPAVDQNSSDGDKADNLFFSSWVTDIDAKDLFDADGFPPNLKMNQLVSLLNMRSIDALGDRALTYSGRGPKNRSWVDDSLELYLTLFNLRGIPYKIRFNDSAFQMLHGSGRLHEVQTGGRPDAAGAHAVRQRLH